MNGRATFSSMLSSVRRAASLIPALLRHDPLFRYAAIAAALAMVFLVGRLAQDMAGPGAIPPKQKELGAPVGEPGNAAAPSPDDGTPLKIAPGRALDGARIEPPPRDSFGTITQGNRTE
jgi:hypothetical protein